MKPGQTNFHSDEKEDHPSDGVGEHGASQRRRQEKTASLSPPNKVIPASKGTPPVLMASSDGAKCRPELKRGKQQAGTDRTSAQRLQDGGDRQSEQRPTKRVRHLRRRKANRT